MNGEHISLFFWINYLSLAIARSGTRNTCREKWQAPVNQKTTGPNYGPAFTCNCPCCTCFACIPYHVMSDSHEQLSTFWQCDISIVARICRNDGSDMLHKHFKRWLKCLRDGQALVFSGTLPSTWDPYGSRISTLRTPSCESGEDFECSQCSKALPYLGMTVCLCMPCYKWTPSVRNFPSLAHALPVPAMFFWWRSLFWEEACPADYFAVSPKISQHPYEQNE